MGCDFKNLYKGLSGVALNCNAPTGGVTKIELADWVEGGYSSVTKWLDVNYNNQDKTTNYVEALTNNDNGSSVVTQTLTVFFAGYNEQTRETLDAICNPNVKLLARITLADGNQVIMGEEFGAVCTQVQSSTGAGTTDSQGYTATFTAEEASHGQVIVNNELDKTSKVFE
jgi:hypothetical protein